MSTPKKVFVVVAEYSGVVNAVWAYASERKAMNKKALVEMHIDENDDTVTVWGCGISNPIPAQSRRSGLQRPRRARARREA